MLPWLDPELCELAGYSRRLRVMLVVAEQNQHQYGYGEHLNAIAGYAQSLRIWLGRPTIGRTDWRDDWTPLTLVDAERCLRRPELMFDGNWLGQGVHRRRSRIDAYQRILDHADRGFGVIRGGYDARDSCVDEGLLRVVKRVEQACEAAMIPIAAELLWVPPEIHDDLWLAGLSDKPAEDWPYCYGRAVKFGHLAEKTFEGMNLVWLNEMVAVQAQRERVPIAPGDPGEFLRHDGHGVVIEAFGVFPEPPHRGERERLWEFYSGSFREGPGCGLPRPLLGGKPAEKIEDG